VRLADGGIAVVGSHFPFYNFRMTCGKSTRFLTEPFRHELHTDIVCPAMKYSWTGCPLSESSKAADYLFARREQFGLLLRHDNSSF
jgi:hypothetical protein